MADQITYLNRNATSPMFARLEQVLEQSKQGRATAVQWASMIRALTQKGVKQLEIDESSILDWLGTQGSEFVSKETLLQRLSALMFTVKEVDLASPKYRQWHQPGGSYHEYLYIANSERDNIVDDLEAVEDKMQNLVFEPERLIDEPDLVVRLERERELLIARKGQAIDFTQHHYSDVVNGRLGRNLLAHCRVTERREDGIYFIEEIQSDWAQRGRKADWKQYPRGPLVTSTEAWAGMVVRRQLQIAARTPGVNTIAWITESMRNGGIQDRAAEDNKAAQKKAFEERVNVLVAESLERLALPADATALQKDEARTLARNNARTQAHNEGLREPPDMLNDFYLKVIPKLVDKHLSGTNVKVAFKQLTLRDRTATVPAIELNDAARARLIDKQPLYSRAQLLPRPRNSDDEAVVRGLATLVRRAGMMLGNPRHVRLVNHVYDVASGHRVAGRYTNRLVQLSLAARDLSEVLDHECFHFAQDVMLTERENRLVLDAFAPGTPLNTSVREVLVRRGDHMLAQQCSDASEAAAQGFALWSANKLDVTDKPAKGLFNEIADGLRAVVKWFRREIFQEKLQTVDDVFRALADGKLAERVHELDLDAVPAQTASVAAERPTAA